MEFIVEKIGMSRTVTVPATAVTLLRVLDTKVCEVLENGKEIGNLLIEFISVSEWVGSMKLSKNLISWSVYPWKTGRWETITIRSAKSGKIEKIVKKLKLAAW